MHTANIQMRVVKGGVWITTENKIGLSQITENKIGISREKGTIQTQTYIL